RARRLNVRAGRYFLRGRAPDVLLEGMVDALPGATLAVDESGFDRTAYARLVRKGGGAASAVASLEGEARVRSVLVGENGACPGAALGVAVALQSFTLKPRFGWCRGGFSNPGIEATVDQYDLELSAVHVRDLHVISVELGLTMGGTLLVQRFRTQGVAPRRTTAALQLSPPVGVTRQRRARSANTPGMLVSVRYGGRERGQRASISSSARRSAPVLTKFLPSSTRHPRSQDELGSAPVMTKRLRIGRVSTAPVST